MEVEMVAVVALVVAVFIFISAAAEILIVVFPGRLPLPSPKKNFFGVQGDNSTCLNCHPGPVDLFGRHEWTFPIRECNSRTLFLCRMHFSGLGPEGRVPEQGHGRGRLLGLVLGLGLHDLGLRFYSGLGFIAS